MNDIKMKCPCCRRPIVKGPMDRYQTLCEHVDDPNGTPPIRSTLICSDDDCLTRKHDVFWDSNGDLYGGFDLDDIHFIKENNAPFGSLNRRLNVEIYKVGLKQRKYLSPWLLLGLYQPVVEWNYRANEDGEVLKTWLSVDYRKKDRDGNGSYCIVVTPFWRTWGFLFGRFKRNKDGYDKYESSDSLRRMFEPSVNRAWPYRSFETFVRLVYPGYYRQYTQSAVKV